VTEQFTKAERRVPEGGRPMTDYAYRITTDTLPVAEVFLPCAFGDCGEEFHLPLAEIPVALPVKQPRISMIEDLAEDAGWSRHLGEPRCPAHPHGHDLGLTALEPAPVDRRTAPFQAIEDLSEDTPMSDFRAPRNPNEDPYANAMLMLGEAMGPRGLSGAIAEQEATGQREIVNSDVIPARLNGCTDKDLIKLGFTLGETVDGDPLFRRATLPPGWSREGSEHAMWSYLLDEQDRRRCSIFYKAAFYDRDAFLSITPIEETP
jgi:hypothetical protein